MVKKKKKKQKIQTFGKKQKIELTTTIKRQIIKGNNKIKKYVMEYQRQDRPIDMISLYAHTQQSDMERTTQHIVH